MKKVLFSFAILAVAATMAACGNKSAQNAESQESAVVAGQQPVEAATAAIAKTIDKGAYSLGLPEGWSVLSEGDTECFVYKGDGSKPSEAIDGQWVSLKIGPLEGKTVDGAVKEMVNEMGAKQLADVTVGGTTYKHCSYVEEGVESRILMTSNDKSGISFMMARINPDDADVQTIISSLKIK